jgi:hypothetical protein
MRVKAIISALFACISMGSAAEISADDTPFPGDPKAFIYGHAPVVHPAAPTSLSAGPLLFLDERYIESSENVTREVIQPKRDASISNPIITGKGDGCFQPYLTVLRDPDTKKFRIWYGRHTDALDSNRSRVGYSESADGIRWEQSRTLDDPSPIQFGVAVVDTKGTRAFQPERRYVYAWHYEGWLTLAGSNDGLSWTELEPARTVKHSHDINGIYYDPVRERFVATLSVYKQGYDWSDRRRTTTHSLSTDLKAWTQPHYVVVPVTNVDDGETQFYAMDGYLARGTMLIGMVKVLRDDLKADTPPEPSDAYGVGYTALAWSHDGEHWLRDTVHYFDPDPAKGAWDHAHAWIDEQVPVGNDLYLYYGGYTHGHKVNRFEERQIGLVRIQRDRYVARAAGATRGILRTTSLIVDGNLTLNADASKGSIRVQAIDDTGKAISGYTFDDCTPITGDALDHKVTWKNSAQIGLKPVRLEFAIENAQVYALGSGVGRPNDPAK